jgi:hypothetical protein
MEMFIGIVVFLLIGFVIYKSRSSSNNQQPPRPEDLEEFKSSRPGNNTREN